MVDLTSVTLTAGIPTAGTGDVQTINALTALVGPLNATKEADPDAASATLLALVRGLISAVAGNVADGAADSGNSSKVGGVARTSNPTAVDSGDRAPILLDKLGKQVVVGAIRDLKGHQATTITSSTTETTIVTAAASTFHDLYGLILSNTSATAIEVEIRDITAGGTPFTIYVPAGDTRGFMLDPGAAIKQGTVNSAWTAKCSASVASLKVTAFFVKNI